MSQFSWRMTIARVHYCGDESCGPVVRESLVGSWSHLPLFGLSTATRFGQDVAVMASALLLYVELSLMRWIL
jgi:hypothetical protein